jgi:protein SCO1/2
MTRRIFFNVVLAAIGLHLISATAHENVGQLDPPIAVPEITVLSADGTRSSFRDLLSGRVTAIQLMFTRCTSICPIEAATLARVQEALGGDALANVRLLSVSIDPQTDTPSMLKAWLERFGARQGWTAVSPAEADLPRVKAFFDGPSSVGEDHSTAISMVDPKGLLVWRTLDLPEPMEVAKLLRDVERASIASARGSGNSGLIGAASKLALDPK